MSIFVELANVNVEFQRAHPLPWKPPISHRAIKDVSFHVAKGEALGLVGESGSGKSTLGRVLLGQQRVSAGCVEVDEYDVAAFDGLPPLDYHKTTQMVWQDPYLSLTPGMRIGDLLAEPITLHFSVSRAAAFDRVRELLDLVGLSAGAMTKRPHEFSGGQRQRIAIARALSLEPSLVILDEPVSALDLLTQAQILTLLDGIRERTGITYLFISHDLSVVRWLCDRILVLHNGVLVEEGAADDVCDRPRAEYTRQLVDSILLP